MGRPRTPSHLKIVAGTFRADRANANEPIPASDLPVAPAWLSERAAEIFRQAVLLLDGMRLASASDTAMLALLASRLEEVEVATAVIEDAGRFYVSSVTKDENGAIVAQQKKSHPAVAQRSEAMRHAQALLGQFGLSPAARGKVSASMVARRSNPFDEFK